MSDLKRENQVDRRNMRRGGQYGTVREAGWGTRVTEEMEGEGVGKGKGSGGKREGVLEERRREGGR